MFFIVLAFLRDKEMAHSIQSPAVDIFSLPPPKKTNLTVVPLSASSGSFVLNPKKEIFKKFCTRTFCTKNKIAKKARLFLNETLLNFALFLINLVCGT